MPQLLRMRDVCELLGVKRDRIYKLVAAGHFPRPIHVSPRAPRWRRETIESWLAEREREAA